MNAKRMRIVLEHTAGITNYGQQGYEDCWCIVAYLDLDGGTQKRVTLHRCKTRSQATKALEAIWRQTALKRAPKVLAA